MLIVGAKGLAKELLQIMQENNRDQNLFFYDDVSQDLPSKLYEKYPILTNTKSVISLFKIDSSFTLSIGRSPLRRKLGQKFENLGGELISILSKEAYISYEDVNIGVGANLMAGVKISNGVSIGKALLAYYDVIITHDVSIGDYVVLSPGCKLLGRVTIENNVHVGAGAIILPDLIVGEGAEIGAGAVVTKNVKPGTVVIGNPAKELIKK